MKAKAVRNSSALKQDWWALHKRLRLMKKGTPPDDFEVMALVKRLDDLDRDLLKLQDERALAEAERKDKGEVLWTLCFPRQYAWERGKFITRTPYCEINATFSVAEPIKQPVRTYQEPDPWKRLDEAWHKKEAA